MVQRSRDKLSLSSLRQLIDEELAGVPVRDREVLVMCDLEGFSRQEVAARLSISRGAVSSRLARARKRFKLRLARRGILLTTSEASLVAAAHAQAALPANASPLEAPLQDGDAMDVHTADRAAMRMQATAIAERALRAMVHAHWKTTARLFALVATSMMTRNLPADWLPTTCDGTFVAWPNQTCDEGAS